MRVLIICSSENNTKIVSAINEAWKNYVQTDGRRQKASADKKNQDNVFVVKSQECYDTLQLEKDKPDFVFIQNELHWGGKSKTISGYEMALDLILHKLKNHYFNIQFISLNTRNALLKSVDGKYKKLVQTFLHLEFSNLKDEISFENNLYTPLHFELIKSLVLDDSNRINVIEHDVDTIKNNIEEALPGLDITPFKSRLQNQIEELSILKFIASDRIEKLNQAICKSTKKETLKKNVFDLEKIIEEAKEQLQNSGGEEFSTTKKTNYKVLIIEDEIAWRTFFSNTFSEIYQTVFPSSKEDIQQFSIAQAKNVINSKKDYNIFILDLLYKDCDDFWLPFNGLDLYQYVKELNPYSSIRIITSLPRDIVSKISGLLLKADIKVSHVFTKKVGYQRLKFGIYDRVLEMNIECKENEKKKTVYKPIPKLGIFGWNGVNDFLFKLMTVENEVYEKCWQKAFIFFNQFEVGKLNLSTTDWKKGELPTPKKKESVTNSYILERLPVVLAHRLLVISKALENKDSIVDADEYEINILKRTSKISTFDKGYLQTKLGFNATPYDNIDDEISGFKIGYKNLFPEEVLFIADTQKKKGKSKKQEEKLQQHPDLSNWFNKVLCDLEIYKSWDELELDFNPYKSVDEINNIGSIELSNIDSTLTLSQFEMYLRSLVKNSYNNLVQKIINQTMNHYSSRNEQDIPSEILTLIDALFKMEN